MPEVAVVPPGLGPGRTDNQSKKDMVTIQLQKEASDATDVVHVRWQAVHVELCEVSDVGLVGC